MALTLVLGMTGCQGSAATVISGNSALPGQIIAGQDQNEAGDGLDESERIRVGWRRQNRESLGLNNSKVGRPSGEPGVIHTPPQTTNKTNEMLAERPADVPDATNAETPDSKPAAIIVNSVSPEAITENFVQTVAAETIVPATEVFAVDLPTILRLAGAHNWAVQLAWERINQAESGVDAAEALWIPSLNAGIGITRHDGQIQATDGRIVDISRNSLFVGGGAKVGNAPITGGAGGPARLAFDLAITDALFQPLVARQLSSAARSRHAAEFNNAQLDGALAFFDLVAAQGEVSTIETNLKDAQDLLSMTRAFVAAGKAAPAEVSRVQVIVANQRQAKVEAQLKFRLASTELIRVTRLDPSYLSSDVLLFSPDEHLKAIELIPESADLDSLIAQGQQSRPEVAEQYALAEAQRASARSQDLRPFVPHLNLGVSAGVFGGGIGGDVRRMDGRSDFDATLIWEVRNLGWGERAARRESASRYRQTVLSAHQVQDQIAADVQNAWHRVRAGRQRMEIARKTVEEASGVLQQNLQRIRGLEGLPLEAIQALNAVSSSRLTLLQTIVNYNKAQAFLLRAVGQPVASALQHERDEAITSKTG